MRDDPNPEASDGEVFCLGVAPVPSGTTISGRSIEPDDFERVEALCDGSLEDATTLDRGWVEDSVVTEAVIAGSVIDRDTASRVEERADPPEMSVELGDADWIGVVEVKGTPSAIAAGIKLLSRDSKDKVRD